jgi:hypothetical protein
MLILKQSHQKYQPLRPFANMSTQAKTKLPIVFNAMTIGKQGL